MKKIQRITCYLPGDERARFILVRRGHGFYKGHYSITEATMSRLQSTCLRMTGHIAVLAMGWTWQRGR